MVRLFKPGDYVRYRNKKFKGIYMILRHIDNDHVIMYHMYNISCLEYVNYKTTAAFESELNWLQP